MNFGRQVFLTLGILGIAGGLWTAFAPGAAPMRARLGLPEAAVEAAAPSGRWARWRWAMRSRRPRWPGRS
jgi:hypothetical protein